MKVLNVAENANGGLGTYFRQMEKNASKEMSLSFVLPRTNVGIVEETCPVYSFNHNGRSPSTVARIIRRTHDAMADLNPDIIVFHAFFSIPAMMFANLLWPSIPRVYVPHGWTPLHYPKGSLRAKVAKIIETVACVAASSVVSVSRSEKVFAEEQIPSGKHVLVENAVCCRDLPAPGPNPTSTRINLLFVGRFDTQKGLDILLQAFGSASRTNPDLFLKIIGKFARDRIDPVEFNLFKSQESCTILGWMPPSELAIHYQMADALVVPSRWEAYGYVVGEAAWYGTPSIVSDRGDLPGRVLDGQTGLVVELPESGDPGPLTACLEKLTLSKLRSMRSETLRNAHSGRTGAVWMDELENLFRQLAN